MAKVTLTYYLHKAARLNPMLVYGPKTQAKARLGGMHLQSQHFRGMGMGTESAQGQPGLHTKEQQSGVLSQKQQQQNVV